jgi:hypothetical protein
MQTLQKQAKKNGVVWLTIVSSAPGEQGYVTGKEADALTVSRSASPTAVVLDPSGEIGRAYDAKTTPHMFDIDSAGTLLQAPMHGRVTRNLRPKDRFLERACS